jgi:hypothetical protein
MGNGPAYFAGYTAQARINRKDFRLMFGKVVDGVALVDDTVEIAGEQEISAPVK